MKTSWIRFMLAAIVLLAFLVAGQTFVSWIRRAEQLKPKDTIVVGMIDDTPPFCFYGEDNKLVGINVDLANELGQRMGKKVHVESVSFNRLTSGLQTRQYDIVSIGSITPHRAHVVRYVRPHLLSADVLLVHPKLSNIQSINAFRDQPWKIGVYNGTSYIQLLKDKGLEKNMVIYPNQRDVFLAFYKHRVDAIIMNQLVGTYIRDHLDPAIVILPEKVRTGRNYAFAVKPDNLVLWRKLDETVKELLADGTYDRIQDHWLHKTMKDKTL